MSEHEHGKDDCVDYIERIVYFIDNELDQADCAVVLAVLVAAHDSFPSPWPGTVAAGSRSLART